MQLRELEQAMRTAVQEQDRKTAVTLMHSLTEGLGRRMLANHVKTWQMSTRVAAVRQQQLQDSAQAY